MDAHPVGSTGAEGGDCAGVILISEVMSDPTSESTGEFVELYNVGPDPVNPAGYFVNDGDAADPLEDFTDPLDTVLEVAGYAVFLDADYPGTYGIPSGTLLLTTGDSGMRLGHDVEVSDFAGDGSGDLLVGSCFSTNADGDIKAGLDPSYGDDELAAVFGGGV